MFTLAEESATLVEIVRIVGPLGGFLVLLVGSLVVLWRTVVAPAMDRIVTIIGQVRDVVSGTERTAQILSKAVERIDPALLDSRNLHGG